MFERAVIAKCRFVQALFACGFLFLSVLGHAQELTLQSDQLYDSRVQIAVLPSSDDTSLTLQLTNTNEQRPTGEGARFIFPRWIVVPPEASISCELKEAKWRVWWTGEENPSGPFDLASGQEVGGFPQQMRSVVADNVGTFRSVGLARVRFPVGAIITDPADRTRRGIVVLDSGRIEIRLGGHRLAEPVEPANLAERDSYLLEFLDKMVINPGDISRYTRAVADGPDLEAWQQWDETRKLAESGGLLCKLPVSSPGIYMLTAREFNAHQIDPNSIFPERLHAFVGNQEIPLERAPGRSGSLRADENLLCYVPNPFPRQVPSIPVWLLQFPEGAVPGAARWPMINSTRSNLGRDAGITLTAKSFVFEPHIYDKRFGASDRTGNWAVRVCNRGQFVHLPVQLASVDVDTTASVLLEFSGYKPTDRRVVDVYMNGVKLGTRDELSGVGPFLRNYAVPARTLQNGRNTLTVHYPELPGDKYDDVLSIMWAEVTFPVDSMNFPPNTEVMLGGEPGKSLDIMVVRPGLDYREISYLLDITEPFAPVRTEVFPTRSKAGEVAVSARLTVSKESRLFYYADTKSTRLFGEYQQRKRVDLLYMPGGADYLVVTTHELASGLEDLMPRLGMGGRRVQVVDIEDVYDTFGYGAKNYVPLADFLRHVFVAWPGPRLRQVLLVGEASEYWWENRMPRADVSPNLIPIYGYGNAKVTIRGDDSYALVTGSDPLADFEIGRFSAKSAAEVRTLARHVVEYETKPPAGPWIARQVFVTDDEPEFANVANRVIESELRHEGDPLRVFLQDHPYEDYFRITSRKRSMEMTRAILDAFSAGSFTFTYFGHGGPNLWSAERIFHYRDLPEINLRGGRSIMAAASCDTAWVDYPTDPVRESLGEQLMLADNGGAIAVFAPIAGTSSFQHDFLIRPFYDALFEQHVPEIGRAALYAKIQYMLEGNSADVPNQFILFGDPALKLPRTTSNVRAKIEPSELFSDQKGTIKIEGETPGFAWGMAEAKLLDSRGFTQAGPVRAPVRDGKFSAELNAPAWIDAGTCRILLMAWNEGEGHFETVSVPMEVREPNVELSWSMTPDGSEAIKTGDNVSVELRAHNKSAGYMRDLTLTLKDAANAQKLKDSPLDLAPGQERVVRFSFPAPSGINRLQAEVRYKKDIQPENPIAKKALEFVAHDEKLPTIAVSSHLVQVTRWSTPERTEFIVPVFNVSGNDLDNVRLTLLLLDKEEGTPVGSEYSQARLMKGRSLDARFSASVSFPQRDLRFRIKAAGTAGDAQVPFEQSVDFALPIPPGGDLLVLPGSTHTERDNYSKGETVFVRAKVQNNGTQPVVQLKTTLYVDFPWDPDSVATCAEALSQASTVFDTPLQPGEEREVRLRWDPDMRSNMNARLYVVTNSDRRVAEANFDNNLGDVAVALAQLPDLTLDPKIILATPRLVRPGEVVSLTIPYANKSTFDFAYPFAITIYADGGGLEEQRIYRGNFERLDAGEEGLLQVNWRADGERDMIHISLNDDRDYGEQTAANNVAVIPISYVIDERFLRQQGGVWDFHATFRYGKRHSLMRAPDESLSLVEFPEKDIRLKFSNESIIGTPLPVEYYRHEADNLMSLDNGGLQWTPYETPRQATFRLPLPKDDATTLYDVYLQQEGEHLKDNIPVNRYSYMVEQDKEWRRMAEPTNETPFLGRFETTDDFLDITFMPSSIPSWTSIVAVIAAPVAGWYESPVYEVARLDNMRLDALYDAPGASRAEFAVRLGTGTSTDPQWSRWFPAKVGSMIAADPEVRFLQWRAALAGDGTNYPVLRNVRMLPLPAGQVAEARQ